MAITVAYRKRSGHVFKISTRGQQFPENNIRGMLTDPPCPDGYDVRRRDPETKLFSDLYQLGYAKIWDGTVVRNATQAELDSIIADELEDDKDMDLAGAREVLKNHPQFRKVFKALAKLFVQQINTLRNLHGLPSITKEQAFTAFENELDRND